MRRDTNHFSHDRPPTLLQPGPIVLDVENGHLTSPGTAAISDRTPARFATRLPGPAPNRPFAEAIPQTSPAESRRSRPRSRRASANTTVAGPARRLALAWSS